MPTSTSNAVVVGGGVFGLAGALELRDRGWGVTLLDAGAIPDERASSTDVSKIVRMDYGSDAFLTELAARATDGWRTWNERFRRPLFHQDGLLVLRAEPLEAGSFEGDSARAMEARGVAVERLEAADLARRFPAWNVERFPYGYFNPQGGWVESGAVVEELAHWARARGVHVIEGAPVMAVEGPHGSTEGVRVRDGTLLEADAVVVAAGARTPALVPDLAPAVQPVGQFVVHVRAHDPRVLNGTTFPAWCADIARTGWYGFPALADGSVKIGHHGRGVAADPGRPDPGVPVRHLRRVHAFLEGAVPSLGDEDVVHARVCYYCDTFDGYFWIAAQPGRARLVVASGGSGHGFKFAPLLGGLVADAVEGVSAPELARFGWRDPGRTASEDARYLEPDGL